MIILDQHVAAFILGCVARLSMAAIFLLAAWHSMRDWPSYSAVVVQYRVAPRRLALLASWLLPPLETVAAVALLALPRAGSALGLLLMVVFTSAVVINLRRGRLDIDCGCGGADGQHLSWGLVVRNAVLMLLLAGAAFAPSGGAVDGATLAGVSGSTGFCVALYFTANQLLTNRQKFGAARGLA